MERLTARTENGNAYLVNVKPDEQEVDSPYKNTLQCILDCFERLAQYEDAEEQGLLVVLPCKVGDTVYSTSPNQDKAIACYVPSLHTIARWIEDGVFGKTVFLTRAEAEEALKGDS